MDRKKAGLALWLPHTLSICIAIDMVWAGSKNLFANSGFEYADAFGLAATW